MSIKTTVTRQLKVRKPNAGPIIYKRKMSLQTIIPPIILIKFNIKPQNKVKNSLKLKSVIRNIRQNWLVKTYAKNVYLRSQY